MEGGGCSPFCGSMGKLLPVVARTTAFLSLSGDFLCFLDQRVRSRPQLGDFLQESMADLE
jgi:hypothetical protein